MDCNVCGQPLTDPISRQVGRCLDCRRRALGGQPAPGAPAQDLAPPGGYLAPPQEGYLAPPQQYEAPPQGYLAPPQEGYVAPPEPPAAPAGPPPPPGAQPQFELQQVDDLGMPSRPLQPGTGYPGAPPPAPAPGYPAAPPPPAPYGPPAPPAYPGAPPYPGVPLPPAGTYREQRQMEGHAPWYSRLVVSMGGGWPLIPWICLAANAGLFWFGIHGDIGALIVYPIQLGAEIIFITWVIADVLDTQSAWWWIPLCIFCWLGFIYYFFAGRQ